jgi:glyoxalase family protein
MQLTGIHHLTAVTANAPGNHRFYTQVLGLRLVKRTVNQDDVSAYHLFYADGKATPGTDLTFFDWPVERERRGTGCVCRTGLRVPPDSLQWWREHLAAAGVPCGAGDADFLEFEDPEGQRFRLVPDDGRAEWHPWEKSSVPAERQIRGLGPITLSVRRLESTEKVLTGLMNMHKVRQSKSLAVFAMGEGGPAAELHVLEEPDQPLARAGAGGVHHVAFRTPNLEEYQAWAERLQAAGVPSSGPVDRFYFRSLYFREPNGVLFEIATDGPGFSADEPEETMGERLALPPFLEARRASIEAGLKPLE